MTEKIPYLITNICEMEKLDFPALEKETGLMLLLFTVLG